jgi:hypothetical protein
MEQNTLFSLIPNQPKECLPFTIVLDELKKIVVRTFDKESHLLFLLESGESWSFYPQPLKVDTNSIIQRITDAMAVIRKSFILEKQVLEVKRLHNGTHASWKTVA